MKKKQSAKKQSAANEELLGSIADTAVEGKAGSEQAEVAKAKPKPTTASKSKPETPGQTVSGYFLHEEIETIDGLRDMVGASQGAGRATILRAALLAVKALKKPQLVELIAEVKASDGRKK